MDPPRTSNAYRRPGGGRIQPGMVAALIAPFETAALDLLPATVCAVTPELRIAYVNPAWRAFGLSNGVAALEAIDVGVDVLAVTPEVLRPYYAELFARARQTRTPLEHDYECSSPELHRVFRMRVHPCSSGALVIVHSLLRQEAHPQAPASALADAYRDDRRIVVQCSNCRRVRRPDAHDAATAAWDWVPAFVEHIPPGTSHGICAVCAQYYYSDFLPTR